MIVVVGAGAILTFGAVAVTLPNVFDRRGAQASPTAARASATRAAAVRSYAYPGHAAPCSRGPRVWEAGSCELVLQSDRYVNPLADATVTPERIDQGVDYAGSGVLAAIGDGTVTYVAGSAAGWPGAFIEYQLVGGRYRGRQVYYAEGVSPASGLRVGETVRAGQAIATIIRDYPTGIEIGWGAGVATNTYAAQRHEWNDTDDADSIPSAAGKSFSALIASLGGPPGKVEG